MKDLSVYTCFMGGMDLREKESLNEGSTMSESVKKFCTDCKTTKTPLWRGGPAGPKSLCNACGINHRKKRRAILGLNKNSENKKVKQRSPSPSPSSSSSSSSSTITTSSPILTTNNIATDNDDMKPSGRVSGSREPLKIRLIALGSEVLLRRSSSSLTWMVKKQRCQRRRKFGEEEGCCCFFDGFVLWLSFFLIKLETQPMLKQKTKPQSKEQG